MRADGVCEVILGLPLYRLQGYQAMLGVPVPDATQWDQIERVADCAYPVFAHLEHLAAQGELIYQDDTSVRILALMAENRTMRPRTKTSSSKSKPSAPHLCAKLHRTFRRSSPT